MATPKRDSLSLPGVARALLQCPHTPGPGCPPSTGDQLAHTLCPSRTSEAENSCPGHGLGRRRTQSGGLGPCGTARPLGWAMLWHRQGGWEPETQPGPGPGSASHPQKLSCTDGPPTPSRQGAHEPSCLDGGWFWKPRCAGRSPHCHWAAIALKVSPCAGRHRG